MMIKGFAIKGIMTVIVRVIVENFEQFKASFDRTIPIREKVGVTSTEVYQSQTNPRELFIVSEYESIEGATSFNVPYQMTEGMKNAGAVGQPDVWFLNKI
jgi:hypothetical protein